MFELGGDVFLASYVLRCMLAPAMKIDLFCIVHSDRIE